MNGEEIKNTKMNATILWIIERRIYFFSIIAFLFFLAIFSYKFSPFSKNKVTNDYQLANTCYENWKSSSYNDQDKLNELKNIINKNSLLKPYYDGSIIQNLILNNKFCDDDQKILECALNRTKDEIPYVFEFSNIAILISKNLYKEALTKCFELKEKMKNDNEFLQKNNILYSLNLFRIALLEEKLNDPNQQLLALNELEDHLNKIKLQINDLNDIFKENDLELIDYIYFKKNQISSN
jgi:hypothetical protein